ncbi:hypothetical protein DEFDS_0890 [Deferribacter desulfuricans SSM1]|uniref:Uncharacterized protein n=1 Tax=Deferribacter desulfuricans (strain DSM 14783 / JCM 11476 / NBRC 101012 / SSM1) TaxID=639282 RepID=D3PCP3_DEFDS|nr:hypothetical protein [Deferribacter desulfuricans]BAI80366.1 hypothetical protein DEFDS_0890 [Deferribacter desulfuricans SSM1]
MVPLMKFKEFCNFLNFLFNYTNLKLTASKIGQIINTYFIKDISKVYLNKNLKSGLFDGTIYLFQENDTTDVFPSNENLIVNANIGLFIFHTNSKGQLTELEFYFEKEYIPAFYMNIFQYFYSEREYELIRRFLKINNIKLKSLKQILSEFQQEELRFIVLE